MHFRVVLIRQIVDPAKDREMRINLVLGGEVDEIIIFDVEIRRAEINLFTRVDPLRCNSGAQFFAPEIGPGNVNFVTWPARQTRALRL